MATLVPLARNSSVSAFLLSAIMSAGFVDAVDGCAEKTVRDNRSILVNPCLRGDCYGRPSTPKWVAKLSGSMTENTIWPGPPPDSGTTRGFAPEMRARALLIGGALVSWALFALLSVWFLVGEHRVDRILLFGLEPPSRDSAGVGYFGGVAWSFTALGSPEIVAFFSAAVLGFLLLLKRLREATFVLVSIGGGTVLGYLAKSVFGYVRPHHAPAADVMINTSFPSGHALLAALFFFSGAILLWKELKASLPRSYVYALAVSAVVLTGTSRVYLGLHWPSDVIAGWAFAVGWTATAHFLVHDLFARRRGT